MKGHVFVLFCGCGLGVSLLAAAEFGIARQPAALAVKSGSVAIFDVGVTGAVAVSYAWYKDGSPVSDNERLSGAQAARLSISPVVVGDAGLYRVQVTDGTNTVFSEEAPLFVDVALPVFTNSPAEQLLSSGSTAVFTAGATGALGIVYCWVREGEPVANNARVSGADSQQLTISAVSNEDTGWYWLTASNAVGVVSSEPARLRVRTASALATATGFEEGVWETGGDANWAPQTLVTMDGNALSHGTIADNQMTYVQMVVFGPGDLEFYWKVSSEASDALVFSIDGADMAWISGEVDWIQHVYHLSSGRHILRWRYQKDGSVSEGADHGYLDRVSFVPTPQVSLGSALSDTPMSVGTSGHAYWFGQTLTSHDGASAARSGYIGNSQYSLLESVVSGPGYVAFYWKVSSEPGRDMLVFTIDGVEMAAISGEVDWQLREFAIPWGIHRLGWKYQKDTSSSVGHDAAWVDQIRFTPVGLCDLAQATDWSATAWTSGGHGPWFGQNEVTSDYAYAGQSSPISHNQTAWLHTTLTGPGTLYFMWRVSSEPSYDKLRFLVDGVEYWRISGETDWTGVTNVIKPGVHLCRWEYSKDGSMSVGRDAGWVDRVSFVPAPPVPVAVNAPGLSWTSSGTSPWYPETVTTHDGEAAVRSGDISHGQSSILQTSVFGPGQGEFYWKVSSEASYDWLIFSIDDVEVARISGEVDWTRREFSVPSGPHTLTWRYQKDGSVSVGRDAAWLDQFAFFGTELKLVNPRVTGTTFSLTVTSALGRTYTLEYKTNLNNPAWTLLIGVQGRGLPLLLLDTNANDVQRFYRVRVE